MVAISQSGETMDTLMALRHAREQGSKVLAICNTQGASIPRESDAVLYTHAGPEVAVASTKAFVAQITAAYVLGLYLAQVKGAMYRDEIAQTLDSLKDMPRKIQWVLDTQTKTVQEAAKQMVDAKSFLFLGRHVGYPVAMEGALKLKEIAYTFTEGFAAGELKHGPIALVDEGEPVVFIVPPARGRNVLHAKVISGIEEVKARGAYIIAVAEENDPDVERYADVVFWRPACPTLMSPLVDVVPLQLFAMDMAKLKNYDVDKPRNLAKSVTVECHATDQRTPMPGATVTEPHIPFEYEVLYEDERIIVIDKPHFLATTPRGMWYRETALIRLRERCGEPDIVPAHRLDRPTAASSSSCAIRPCAARTRCSSRITWPSKPTNAWRRSPRRSVRATEQSNRSTGIGRSQRYAGRASTRTAADYRRTKAPICRTRRR